MTKTTEQNREAVSRHYENNKFEIQKARVLKRIKEGSKPQKATLEKYGITLEGEENEPKQETRGRKKGSHKGISIEHIKTYYNQLVENDEMAKNSAKNYISRLKIIMKETQNCDIDDDVVPCMKKFDDFIQAIEEKYTSETTRFAHLQTIVKAIDTYPSLKKKVPFQRYKDKLLEFKTRSDEEQVQKKVEDEVPPFSEIKDKVYDNYPAGSKERLLIDLYDELTLRDDFGDVEFITSRKSETDGKQNYLNLRAKELVLNNYKTVNKYGKQRFKLSEDLMKKIKKSLKDDPRLFLFSSKMNNMKPAGSMPHTLAAMFMKSKVKGKDKVNLLRHAKLSEELDGENLKDKDKRRELFEKMLHSPFTQLKYLRTLHDAS